MTGGGCDTNFLGSALLRDATRRKAGLFLNMRFICVLLCLPRMATVVICVCVAILVAASLSEGNIFPAMNLGFGW